MTAICPFCILEKLTPWYLHDVKNNIVACRDLNDRQYSYRILVVGIGPKWHKPFDKLWNFDRQLLTQIAKAIAQHHIEIGYARDLIKLDTTEHSDPDHAHIQACMQRASSPPTHLSCAYQDSQGHCSHPDRTSNTCVDGGCFQGLTHPLSTKRARENHQKKRRG